MEELSDTERKRIWDHLGPFCLAMRPSRIREFLEVVDDANKKADEVIRRLCEEPPDPDDPVSYIERLCKEVADG